SLGRLTETERAIVASLVPVPGGVVDVHVDDVIGLKRAPSRATEVGPAIGTGGAKHPGIDFAAIGVTSFENLAQNLILADARPSGVFQRFEHGITDDAGVAQARDLLRKFKFPGLEHRQIAFTAGLD